MSKTENVFNTTLRLNLDHSEDREALDNLLSVDRSLPEYSSYSRTIVTALNDHFARLDQQEVERDCEASLLKKVEDTVRTTLLSVLKEIPVTGSPVKELSAAPAEPEPPDESEEAILNFLDGY